MNGNIASAKRNNKAKKSHLNTICIYTFIPLFFSFHSFFFTCYLCLFFCLLCARSFQAHSVDQFLIALNNNSFYCFCFRWLVNRVRKSFKCSDIYIKNKMFKNLNFLPVRLFRFFYCCFCVTSWWYVRVFC